MSEVLDSNVGISDTGSMIRPMSASAANAELDFGGELAPGAVGAVVYDTLGMPMTLRAAREMSKDSIQAALQRALSALHHGVAPAGAPTAPIDSLEVVFLLGKFYRSLRRKALDLTKVERDRWSNLAGVADVLHEAMQGLS